MEKFEIERTKDGDVLRVHKSGPDLLRYPLYNKGTGFTYTERRELGIEALLPAEYNDIDTQVERIFKSIFFDNNDVGRNIGLAMLQDRNEVLFYKVLSQHLEQIMPIVYTPTVGEASRYYSRVFRRGRGLFITPDYAGRIEEVIRDAAPFTAATETRPSKPLTSSWASSNGIPITAIRPLPVACCIRRPRWKMTVIASLNESTPATCAAATSPMLCPMTASGTTPHERQSAANAT